MAIAFGRKEGERYVILAPDGKELWMLLRDGRAIIAFELPEGYRVLREEVYRREINGVGCLRKEQVRPAISRPIDSPLKETVF